VTQNLQKPIYNPKIEIYFFTKRLKKDGLNNSLSILVLY
jgi:hypothetical protein